MILFTALFIALILLLLSELYTGQIFVLSVLPFANRHTNWRTIAAQAIITIGGRRLFLERPSAP